MHVDQFELRLAKVRHRFAVSLESKIKRAAVSIHSISSSDDDVVNQISHYYRDLHGMCGIGPTVGFTATGEAARAAELVLTEALREKRGLNEKETLRLKGAIEQLQRAAESELRSMYQRGG
jgi:hypothetical protein